VQAVRAFQPKGPYYLGGYCFGGNVAYEMARQLVAQGEPVAIVALLDSSPANSGYERIRWWHPVFPFRFARNVAFWLQDFIALPGAERRRFLARKARTFARKAARLFRPKSGGVDSFDLEEIIELSHFPEHELKLWRVHLQALEAHRERDYSGRVTLLRTRGQPLFCSLEDDFCWSRLARGGVALRRIQGSHENIFLEPNVGPLAAELTACLEAASAEAERETRTHH